MRTRALLMTTGAALLVTACEPGAPTAALEVSPLSGRAPLEVLLDASASADAAGQALTFRFDVDGDGSWDTEESTDSRHAAVLERAGSFFARVEVTTADGRVAVAVAPAAVEVTAALADIDADANRDGIVDDSDKSDEEPWSDARGAAFLSNWDDDDGDGDRDAADELVNNEDDALDLAPLVVRRSPGLPQSATVVVRVEPAAAAERVRLFRREGFTPFIDVNGGQGELSATDVREGDVELLLEGVGGRNARWDGRVKITVAMEDGGELLGEDSVELRVAPTLFPDDTRPAERVYVMKITDAQLGENNGFYDALVSGMPEGVAVYDVDQYEYWGDRWVQDNMQTGYQRVPGEGGARTQLNYLETQRATGWGGLETLVTDELLDGDFGFAYLGGAETSLNYGGNLEVAPAHEAGGVSFPFGRLMIGGGAGGTVLGASYEDHMNDEQRGYLDAQEAQGPVMELSTEWLAVGHLDEIFLFVPDMNRAERPWRVVIASPALARGELLRLEGLGQGGAVVFEGRELQTTVSEILADSDLMAFNEAVQARIDGVREQLMAEMELADDDFVEVPVLHQPHFYGGRDFSSAYSPGIQNLVPVLNKLFIPDPEGPDHLGKDAWQQRTVENLAATGLELEFVDIFDSYHLLMGEAHCGTNIRHTPYEKEWWTP